MTDIDATTGTTTNGGAATTEVDVLIVGAGISGIGGAYHLQQQCPDKRFVILESQEGFGGTWRTHTYPGIRSDSDLFTFGYRFKPWTGVPIATAEEILRYMGEVIEDNDLARHIRYRHRITNAVWDSDDRRWTIHAVETADDGTESARTFSAGFLYMCQGYYRHDEGYTPEWPGMGRFQGEIVHPMRWPDELDYSGKRVIVIGSGATAATIVPAMADKAEHITMLQRSPTYFATGRNHNELAQMLRELEVPDEWTHEIVRRKILFDQANITTMSREHPELVKAELFGGIKAILGDDYDLDPHFTPSYRPWHQRIAFVPDGDLFHAIADDKASVVTDHIDTFTETGITLASGETIDADLIITATGFNLNVLGDIDFTVDDEPLAFARTITYRGAMFTGIPNMAWVFGYFRASWTLRADLIGDLVCRLLQTMDDKGASMVVPALRPEDDGMSLAPWVDPEDFDPGYLRRGVHLLPQQGDREPWLHTQDYWTEKDKLPLIDLDDGSLRFS
ncbi:MAG: NAD(P)/FAD-dependent oxidoreductase [Actinomycetota bacterium]